MNTRPGWMVVALIGFLLSGCGISEQAKAEKEAADAELKKLDGKWKVASREGQLNEDDGDDPRPESEAASYFVIENGILREEFKGKDGNVEVASRRKLVLMPMKTPKAVNLIYLDENGKEMKERSTKKTFKGKKKKVTTVKDVGIYKLDGNKLEMCISGDDKNRPTDFTAPARSNRYLLKLEKIGGDARPEEKDGKDKEARDKDGKDKDKKDKDKDGKDKDGRDKDKKDKDKKDKDK